MSDQNLLYSQVFNFGGPDQDGVDLRTGLYLRNLDLYQAPSDVLNCPSLQLSLRYNSLIRQDIGFGKGWKYNLSSYNRASNTLILSTGEHFQVAEAGSSATVVDQKLKNFLFKKKGSDYHIVHKNGRIEILSHNNNKFDEAVLIELHAPNGRSIQLAWTQMEGQTRLQTIKEKSRVLLRIEYNKSKAEVIRAPGTIGTSTLTLTQNKSKLLDQLQLPLEEGFWRFTYQELGETTCLIKVSSPTGLIEELQYDDKSHIMPNRGPHQYIPCVIQHTIRPGNLQPPIITKYSYSDQNFLAYKGVRDWKQGEDNLYRAGNTYQYSVTVQILGGRRTKYVYNKFHLLIGIQQQQGTNSITTNIEYNALDDASFQHQSSTYQLPTKIQTTYMDSNGNSRTETTQFAFDDWGNIAKRIEPSGIRIDYIYFPASGEKSFCPADPNGFQRYLKSVKITPAPRVASIPSVKQAPIQNVLYKYCELPTVEKAIIGYYVAIHEVQRWEEDHLLMSVINTYIKNEKDRTGDHGRLQQQILQLKGKYETKYTWKYSTLSADQLKKTTEIITHDHHTERSDTIFSTNSGFVVSHKNKDEIERHIQYDKIGRVTIDMVSPGKKPYETVMKHTYTVTEGVSGYSMTTMDSQGLQTRHHTDGLGRICRIERQDDSDGVLGPFRVIQERSYNNVGQLAVLNNIDWIKMSDKSLEQHNEQRFEYDDWGCLNKMTDSSGAVILAETNLVSMTHIEGIQGEGQIKTEFNQFGAVSQKVSLKSDGRAYKIIDYTYDGLGRLIGERDNSKNVTAYELDAFGRLVQTICPNGRKISIQYEAHSASALPVSTKVDDYTIGTQAFDGSSRIISQTLGTRTTNMSYTGNEPHPASIKTSQGDELDLAYDPALDYAVVSVKSKDELETYKYDQRSSALLVLKGSCVAELREYLPSGLLAKEKTQVNRKKQFSTQSTYSMAGKLKTYTDVHGQMLKTQYDQFGRPKQMMQGGSRTTLVYDKSNRLSKRCCYDDEKKQSLKTSLKFDEFGREIERIVHAGKTSLYQLEQTFNEMSLLTSRTLKGDKDKLLREESFEYDQQGRLVDYKYRGTQPMIDEAGQNISRQQFSFDKYDNLVKIVNTFEDRSQNIRSYFYNPKDPTQLTRITNTHRKYARDVALAYDRNGCLTSDEQGRKLDYDAKGRLSAVSDAKNKILSQYYYDASGKLVWQKAGSLDTYLHYRGGKLVAITSGEQKTSLLTDGKASWGQITTQRNGSSQIRLWATDCHQSVLAWFDTNKPDNIKQQLYMPYGHGQSDCFGFNGQWKDPITGWYHLGNGCRVYNPVLMRFHSPDQWSPFVSGEINPYAYCLNDPINRTDPTGHVSIFGMDDSRANTAFLSQPLGPLQVTVKEGPLLNGPEEQPPWAGQVAYFDSINGVPGLQGFMTHGDTSGRLLGWRNTVQNGAIIEGLWGDTATNVAQDTILPTIQHNIDHKAGFFPQQLGKPIYLFSCNGADPISFGGRQLASTGQRVANALNREVIAFHGELTVLPEFRLANIGMIHNILETGGGVQRVYGYNRTRTFQPQNG
jgi:RHS repeat-associated protein